MDGDLLRALSDQHGNTLLHIVSAAGNTRTLQWLVKDQKLEPGLTDENRNGITPIVMAVKVSQNHQNKNSKSF